MVQSQYSLSWDSYKSNICTGFSSLQQNGELVDLTLAADGHLVKVHKVLMALSSPYLRDLISSAPCQHPVIFLNNVSHATLCLILEYIYTGQVLVPSKNLNSFIETAKALHIRGLENVDSDGNSYEEKTLDSSYVDSSASSVKRISSFKDEISLPINAKRISIKHEISANKPNRTKLSTNDIEANEDNMQDSTFDDTDMHDYEEIHVEETPDIKIAPENKSRAVDSAASSNLQYTVSIRGSLQVILNRYIYNMHSTQASGVRRWRCIDYRNKKCMAFLVTRGSVVLNRANLHCHSFHDKKILTKIEKNAVYSAIQDVEGYKEKIKTTDKNMSLENEELIGDSDMGDQNT